MPHDQTRAVLTHDVLQFGSGDVAIVVFIKDLAVSTSSEADLDPFKPALKRYIP